MVLGRVLLRCAFAVAVLFVTAVSYSSSVKVREIDNVPGNDWDTYHDTPYDYIDYPAPDLSYSEETKTLTTKYEPTWESLDSRPLPTWYDESKFGIFIHWGVYSVPSYGGAWFWYKWKHDKNSAIVNFMKKNYPPTFTYQDFGPLFTAQFYNPKEWVELFAKTGARYVVLTSKHHEGFTNWPSKYSFGWNSMDVGPKRDLVGELEQAVRNSSTGMHFGLYHSLFEFFNPLYLNDKALGTREFPEFKTIPELYELVERYKPELIWSDGDRPTDTSDYWKSPDFLAWLYNESPVKDTVVVNDRWGTDTPCKHGGYFTCHDNYNPGILQKYKWENAFTLDKSAWAYRTGLKVSDYRNINDLIAEFVTTISCGGNVLLNVGPTHEGTIIPIMQERLLQVGAWLKVNGDGFYETTPWKVSQNDSTSEYIWYTSKPKLNKLFAFALKEWPSNNEDANDRKVVLGSLNIVGRPYDITKIEILGYPGKSLRWTISSHPDGIVVQLPNYGSVKSNFGWALEITFAPHFSPF